MSVRVAVAVAALAAFLAPAAGARSPYQGSVCGLLTPAQLVAVHVTTRTCSQTTAPVSVFGTGTSARWGSLHANFVLVVVYNVKPGYLAPGKQALSKDGPPVGVGDWSAFRGMANGKTEGGLWFSVGNRIVDVDVHAPIGKPFTSSAPVIKLAKQLAAALKS